MLIRSIVDNFRSLKERKGLAGVAPSLKDLPHALTSPEGLRFGLLNVAAIYGANASGKTKVLPALHYMKTAVKASQSHGEPDGAVPRDPFLLDEESSKALSLFEVDFLLQGVRYQYGFALNDDEVLEEWLYAYPIGNWNRQMRFTREGGQKKWYTFGKKLLGENRATGSLMRKSSLFLSAAAENARETLLPIYKWFSGECTFITRHSETLGSDTAEMGTEERHSSAVSKLLGAADLGVVGLDVKEEDFLDVRGADKDLKEFVEAFKVVMAKLPKFEMPGKVRKVSPPHEGRGETPVPFPSMNESDGALAFLGLLGPIVRAIESQLAQTCARQRFTLRFFLRATLLLLQ